MGDDYDMLDIDGHEFETSKGTFTARLIQPPTGKANSTNVGHLFDFTSNNQTRRVCLWIPGEEEAIDPTLTTLRPRVERAVQEWIESPAFNSHELNFIYLHDKFDIYNPYG
jgi:hypothetical protein